MGGMLRRMAHLLLLAVLMLSSVVPPGWAKQSTALSHEAGDKPRESEWTTLAHQEGEGGEETTAEEAKEADDSDSVTGEEELGAGDVGEEGEEAEEVEDGIHESDEQADRNLQEQEEEFTRRFSGRKKPSEVELRALPATYELEPNDTFSKADWMFAGKDAYGRIGKSGDVDVWKMKAPTNGTITFTLFDIPSKTDYFLYVFDSEGRELGRSDQPRSDRQRVEDVAVEKNNWYYVKVEGSQGAFNKKVYYRLRADAVAQNEGKQDEYEPNDTIKNAREPEDRENIVANLHHLDDVDFYRVTVNLSSTIRATLSNIPEGMDLDLYLYNKENKLVARSEKAKNADELIVYNGDPGTYFVKVSASRSSALKPHAYKLSITTATIPVILIPGIGGSRLEVEENGKTSEIWLGLWEMSVGIKDPRHRKILSLEPVKNGSINVQPRQPGIKVFPERADGGFRAIEYLSYASLDVIKKKAEQYASMVKHLEKMGYEKNRTLFAMPYDWRYSNADNATFLKQKIDEALKRSGASQVQLVAHSMGGLLVRETLLSNVSYQQKTKRIIYMGTPFLGSPRAYQAIKYGYNFDIPALHEETGKVISAYAPAVYELLPSRKYFDTEAFLKKDAVHSYSYKEFLQDRQIRLDYDPLVKQAGELHEKWDNKIIYVPQYSIIGIGQTTLLGYVMNPVSRQLEPFFDKGFGDGTVPYVSATYAQKDIKKQYFILEEHAKLPVNPYVIQQVGHLLIGIEDVQKGMRRTPKQTSSYLYYILSREDGEFPEVIVSKSGRSMRIDPEKKEVWDDVRVEYHGNIVVIHVLDGQPLHFQEMPRSKHSSSAKLLIRRFSSDDQQESGRLFRLVENRMEHVKGIEIDER
ncbi:pre-peptidase C-terminal domain-containing protein [Brevibacillus sp. NL20B1]|jgi:pimeloyl-ACP methyl ester carboxylesterase|uniref:lipase/acyltransferase domain-containing protein n=1 Tax=Brevibacillus sp. NL20B1 TaxID=2829799 RepID=UPI001B9123FB|nr:pre-peptidase C-terminal domain-containing protein [Brevibacillus sp. NL20B1]MBR8659799.1 pre-peptidase C-terminal domain-containing protein [Brevibacillus sp. NL20B1]